MSDTIQVNGGSLVAAAESDTNAGLNWGIGATPLLALARTNLWRDASDNPGYDAGVGVPWTSPGAVAYQVTNGVRFRSLTGKAPKVVTTGTWAATELVARREIETWFITSGKPEPEGNMWRPQWLVLDVQTQRPSYSVNVLTEGVEESESVILNSTRSRTAYAKHGLPAWDQTNVNDDFETPWREDYSVIPGTAGIYLKAGIRTDLYQESRQEKQVGVIVGRAPRIEVRNTQGRLRLMGCTLEGEVERAGEGITI